MLFAMSDPSRYHYRFGRKYYFHVGEEDFNQLYSSSEEIPLIPGTQSTSNSHDSNIRKYEAREIVSMICSVKFDVICFMDFT